MRELLLFIVLLVFPLSASAAPELALARSGDDIKVKESGLDADRTYWVTIVPRSADEGAYAAYHYLSGSQEARASFPVPGPGETMEIRLHERSDGDPLLDRAALAAPVQVPVPEGDPATVAFARKYGLAGAWRGGMTCSQGAARFDITLRPHFYENGYLGELHVTIVDGPDEGATGSWPLLAQLTPKTRGIALTPDSPLSVPVEGYSIPHIFGTTLSEDGLRVENADLQSHDCTDFRFERVPLPSPEEAAAAAENLRTQGFLGQWQGNYNCGVDTALELGLDMDPLNGLTLARWVYRGIGFEGEAIFRAEAGGPGQVSLTPLQWVVQPYRHQALPATFSIAPDGAVMQGEIADCGPVSVSRAQRDAASTPSLLDEADRSAIANMAGLWSGFAQCDGAERYFELDLSDLIGGGGSAHLRYIATDGVDTTTHLVLDAQPGNPVGLSLIEQRSSKLNQPSYLPRHVTASDGQLILPFENGCDEVTLGRIETPPAYAALPGHADQGTLLVSEDGDTAVRVAPPARICDSLAGWVDALGDSEARMTRAGSWVTDYGGWPALFADRYFEPVFGMGYDRLSASPAVGQALIDPLRKTCGDLGVEDLDLRTALSLAFGVERHSEIFGSKAQKFRLAVAKTRMQQQEVAKLADAIGALPADPASRDGIAALRAQLQALPVLESDAARLAASLDEKAVRIGRKQTDTFLAALADGVEAPTPQSLARAVQELQDRSPEDRARWIERLDVAAETLAGRVERPSGDELEALRQLAMFPPIADAVARAEEGQRIEQAEAEAAIKDRIANVTRIGQLRPVLTEIHEAHGGDPRMLADYDAKAGELLAAAVAQAPAASMPKTEPALSSGNLAGLRRNALITAFLNGDRLVPYRADRNGTMLYLQRMTRVFREFCPAALPPDLPNRIAGHFVDLGALTGSRDQVAAQGLNAIVEGLNMLADPGAAMSGAMRQDEIFATADGDAQILLRNLDCTGPELRRLFEHARDYVIDPGRDLPIESLTMADVCLLALDDGMIMDDTRAYCGCAGQIIDRADADVRIYLRADPQAHFRQISLFDRSLHRSLQECRR